MNATRGSFRFYADARAIVIDPETASLKRIAYAYGVAKAGSDEEKQLLAVLVERIQSEAP